MIKRTDYLWGGQIKHIVLRRRQEMHGLRLGVDEPSRVLRVTVISSREEALNMMPVEVESNWTPKQRRNDPSPTGTRVGCQRGHTIWKYIARPGWVKGERDFRITWTPLRLWQAGGP